MATTLTVNIKNEKDPSVIKEILDRFGLEYAVENNQEYEFLNEEIQSLLKTTQDYLDGETTARDWEEIKEELNRSFQ